MLDIFAKVPDKDISIRKALSSTSFSEQDSAFRSSDHNSSGTPQVVWPFSFINWQLIFSLH